MFTYDVSLYIKAIINFNAHIISRPIPAWEEFIRVTVY